MRVYILTHDSYHPSMEDDCGNLKIVKVATARKFLVGFLRRSSEVVDSRRDADGVCHSYEIEVWENNAGHRVESMTPSVFLERYG